MNPVEDWLLHVAAKKAIYTAAKVLTSWVTSGIVMAELQKLGVTVDQAKFQMGATALMTSGLEAAHDYLRVKFPNVSWL